MNSTVTSMSKLFDYLSFVKRINGIVAIFFVDTRSYIL